MQKLHKLIIPVVTKFNTKLSNISNRVTSKKKKTSRDREATK